MPCCAAAGGSFQLLLLLLLCATVLCCAGWSIAPWTQADNPVLRKALTCLAALAAKGTEGAPQRARGQQGMPHLRLPIPARVAAEGLFLSAC